MQLRAVMVCGWGLGGWGVYDSMCLVKRPAQAFSQRGERHVEMSGPANRSLEAF